MQVLLEMIKFGVLLEIIKFHHIKVCQMQALLEMRVLFKGGPYMRKYGKYCLQDLFVF